MTLDLTDVSYDWDQVFSVAAEEGYTKVNPTKDIKRVVASIEGEPNGENWQAVVELKNGGYLWLSSWCDYTGWGCQAGGSCMFGNTLEALFNPYNMPHETREVFAPLISEIKINLEI